MIEPYLIRSRLFQALGVPAPLWPILHAWALIENRKFCHEFMGNLLGLTGSEHTVRIAVGRKLDALALFLKTSGYDLGTIDRGGGKGKETTSYGVFTPNHAVSWIQDQLSTDPDTSNPFVAIDRYISAAIALSISKIQEPTKEKKKKQPHKRRRGRVDRNTLSHKYVALQNLPNCTFLLALKLARFGFRVFPVHTAVAGVCSCHKGSECKNSGKHPCIARWQQVATCCEALLIKLWEKFPFANVGIATGVRMANGEFLTVIDCDFRHFGHGSISHLERNELCPLPDTREHSAGGGPHKLYTHPRGFRSRPGALGQGIDIQSFGKFVIGAGMNARGTPYEVTVDLPIARLPDEWAERIEAIRNKTLPLIPEGQRRAKLLSWAGGMVHSGLLPDLILETLRDKRDRRCAKGSHSFTDDDLRGMIDYCLKQESQKKKERAA